MRLLNSSLGGGKGPGAYYVWVYLQLAFLLPLFYSFFKSLPTRRLILISVFACVGFEIVLSYISIPESLYRLLCIRYLFLIPLGIIWVRDGIKLTNKSIIASLLSMVATVFFYYNSDVLEPFFVSTNWKTHRWICYSYVAFLLPAVLWVFFKKMENIVRVKNFILIAGKASYEIFIIQMAIFVIIPLISEPIISNKVIRVAIFNPVAFFLSIVLGIQLNKYIVNKRARMSVLQ